MQLPTKQKPYSLVPIPLPSSNDTCQVCPLLGRPDWCRMTQGVWWYHTTWILGEGDKWQSREPRTSVHPPAPIKALLLKWRRYRLMSQFSMNLTAYLRELTKIPPAAGDSLTQTARNLPGKGRFTVWASARGLFSYSSAADWCSQSLLS